MPREVPKRIENIYASDRNTIITGADVERVGERSRMGTGRERGRAHPFEISPPPPGCLERVRCERDVQLTHPFETTGGGGGLFSKGVC